jgi:hypothetical protein
MSLTRIKFQQIKFDYGILSIVKTKRLDLTFLFLEIKSRVIHTSSKLTLAIENWLKTSSSRGPDLRIYVEKYQDVWHPTVSVLPRRSPLLPPPYEDKESISPLRLSNGSLEPDQTQDLDWPEVGPRPGVYNARHDAVMILIFLKWFDVEDQVIRGQRPIYVNRHDKTGKLSPIVSDMMGWHSDEPIQVAFYEEIKPGMIEPLKPNATFIASEIQDGDILCFTRVQSQKRYISTLIN